MIDLGLEQEFVGAAMQEDWAAVRQFFADHPDWVNRRDSTGQTMLIRAGIFPSWVKVAEILLDAGAEVDARDKSGCTALYLAAAFDNIAAAKLLVSHGANVNGQDNEGMVPLGVAVVCNNAEMVRYLMRAHANPLICSANSLSPIMLAQNMRKFDLVDIMINRSK